VEEWQAQESLPDLPIEKWLFAGSGNKQPWIRRKEE
jgi:hypothetical protein